MQQQYLGVVVVFVVVVVVERMFSCTTCYLREALPSLGTV
jgi:hypothetical protein